MTTARPDAGISIAALDAALAGVEAALHGAAAAVAAIRQSLGGVPMAGAVGSYVETQPLGATGKATPVILDWLDSVLTAGRLSPEHDGWERKILRARLYALYSAFARSHRSEVRVNGEAFSKALRSVFISSPIEYIKIWRQKYTAEGEPIFDDLGAPVMRRVNGYMLPSLSDCRADFAQLTGRHLEWLGGNPLNKKET